MFCNNCGKDIGNVNVKFCPYCGGKTDISQGADAVTIKKVNAPKTNYGKPPVNKTSIIITSIIAAAAIVIVFLILNSNGLSVHENGRDLIGLVNSGEPESPSTAGIKIESVGDIVEFGTWRGQPIEWRVLDIENNRALLISKGILTVRQYDGLTEYGEPSNKEDWYNVKVTWADSDIRVWLNDDFLNEAFSKSEQKSILLSQVSNQYNTKFGTNGGKDTEDKVFFLSISEANQFFKDDDDRIAKFKMTEDDLQYTLKILREDWGFSQVELDEKEESFRSEYIGQRQAWWWWLRSPGEFGSDVAYVGVGGIVDHFGYDVDRDRGVRPAFYISLKS